MTFKVGDKVVDVCSGYILENKLPVTTGVVTRIEADGGYKVLFDGLEYSYLCLEGEVKSAPIGKTLQELNVQVGDVVQATDGVFEGYGNFTCTGISDSDYHRGYRYMNSDVYPYGLFGPENGLWEIVSRAPITEPTPPRKMHPDDFVNAVNDFARDNGFGIISMEFGGAFNNGLSRHTYSV